MKTPCAEHGVCPRAKKQLLSVLSVSVITEFATAGWILARQRLGKDVIASLFQCVQEQGKIGWTERGRILPFLLLAVEIPPRFDRNGTVMWSTT